MSAQFTSVYIFVGTGLCMLDKRFSVSLYRSAASVLLYAGGQTGICEEPLSSEVECWWDGFHSSRLTS